jgi:hypothetical protein
MEFDPLLLPRHGRIECSRCFPVGVAWGEAFYPSPGWQLERNPCAWGSRDPRVLILGFSKGANQTAALSSAEFDAVPFKGMRSRLTAILQTLGLLDSGDQIDDHISAEERDFAFGSLIRCAASNLDRRTGQYVKSGDIISRAAKGECGGDFISACIAQFLASFPPRLRYIVMLGNSTPYIQYCTERLRQVHPNFRTLNPVAYAVGQVRFIHVVHPSGSSGRHVSDWLTGKAGVQATKRVLAMQAVQNIESV